MLQCFLRQYCREGSGRAYSEENMNKRNLTWEWNCYNAHNRRDSGLSHCGITSVEGTPVTFARIGGTREVKRNVFIHRRSVLTKTKIALMLSCISALRCWVVRDCRIVWDGENWRSFRCHGQTSRNSRSSPMHSFANFSSNQIANPLFAPGRWAVALMEMRCNQTWNSVDSQFVRSGDRSSIEKLVLDPPRHVNIFWLLHFLVLVDWEPHRKLEITSWNLLVIDEWHDRIASFLCRLLFWGFQKALAPFWSSFC
jgi:hypothetical protein